MRPQIIVNVTSAPVLRGVDTLTGTAFMAYTGATGPQTEPVVCLSPADATAAGVPDAVALLVGDALALGAPKVVVIRVDAAAAEPTQTEWETALALFDDAYGLGQVLIPGVTTTAAHTALLTHAAATGRTVLLDAAADATATALAALAAGLAAADGSERAGLIAPWVTKAVPGGGTRQVPGSVVAAGLAAREDAFVGHTNHAPAGDKGHNAGVVDGALDVTERFTNAQLDTLHDAGVSVIKPIKNTPTLYGWVSLSADRVFRQLNSGRTAMALTTQLRETCAKFLFRNIDGRGQLYAELEGALRGMLVPLWERGALYGETADAAFDVDTKSVNTPATAAAGELHAQVAVTLSQHTERVVFDVAVSIAA